MPLCLDVLTKRSPEAFEAAYYHRTATLPHAVLLVTVAVIPSALVSLLFLALLYLFPVAESLRGVATRGGEVGRSLYQGMALVALVGGITIGQIIAVPVGFLLFTGTIHGLARQLGGSARLGSFAFLLALIQAPVSVLVLGVSLVPIVGSLLAVALSFYAIYLAYLATRYVHGLSGGSALVAVGSATVAQWLFSLLLALVGIALFITVLYTIST